MNSARQADPFMPERTILQLGDTMFDRVAPADFPKTILRFRNDRAAATVGLNDLDDAACTPEAVKDRIDEFIGGLKGSIDPLAFADLNSVANAFSNAQSVEAQC
jgi:uncharacterized protein YdiU (UPF0061 family)